MNDEEKRKDEENEQIDVINEADLTEVIKNAVKEAQKENRKVVLTDEMLDKMVDERLQERLDAEKDISQKREMSKDKYKEFVGKRKILQMLEDEREKALLALSALDATDPKYKETYNNYKLLCESYDNVANNPLDKIDWGRVITVCIIVGACSLLVFLLLIIENSPYFPRSRNALNLIMNIFKAGVKL